MNPEKTGLIIKNARIKKGLTQKQLADAISVTDKAVCKWETGRGCPDITLLSQLSRILEMHVVRGVILYMLIAAPWYYAMYTVHGMEFIKTFFHKF